MITHVHLNDGTVAGFRHATRPIYSVQFHPEASPGPHDASLFFDAFVARIKGALSASTSK
jgi:carbamoyl-phosphate synthase small subunit